LTGSGEIYCWGGGNGGLGNGTYDGAIVPTNIGAGRSYAAIAASDRGTCALAVEGSVYCWGNDTFGELGGGENERELLSPAVVATSLTFKAIAMSFDSTCGLTDEGTAYCWGSNRAGNLGLGAFDNDPHPSPEAVSGGLVFSMLAGGSGGFCGLDPNAEAYCWGFAGTEDHIAVPGPTRASGELIFSQISVGKDVNCAIATNGLAATYCWIHGSGNSDGYLGTGDTEDYIGPVPIAEP